jgi:hypothetical protein
MTGGDVCRIDTIKSYPEDYTEATNIVKKELHDNARPELSSHVDNMNSYNVIFLGYPLVGNNADAGIHNRDNVAYTVFVHSIENETKMS